MAEDDFDLVVIGCGPAGEKGAAQAAYFDKRVAVIERAQQPGGAAVHTGTLPSKSLREAALFLSGYRQRDLYGITVEVEPDLAISKLIARKDAVREEETARVLRNLDRHGIELIHGAGRVTGPNEVVVGVPHGDQGDRTLRAEAILIATGSRPHRPSWAPFDDADVHDSDGILRIDRVPRSLVVIGGGVIGCEYASMFAALGVETHVVDARERILPFLDDEIVAHLRRGMSALGVTFHLGHAPEALDRSGDGSGLRARLQDGEEIAAEKALVTLGRSGNTEGLGLDEIGVGIDKRGYVEVDADGRTAVPSVFAAGDVVGFPALASTSMEQARVAVCKAFGFTYKQEVSSLLPYGVYTIPEVSSVGVTEQDARESGRDVVVGRASFADNARGQILGDHEGMVKLVFERSTRRLIGCHCIGERASELVHIGQAIVALGGTAETLIELVFNYPTLSEAYKYAAYEALARLDAPDPLSPQGGGAGTGSDP
jgi:NAD(P) transhydrogenase